MARSNKNKNIWYYNQWHSDIDLAIVLFNQIRSQDTDNNTTELRMSLEHLNNALSAVKVENEDTRILIEQIQSFQKELDQLHIDDKSNNRFFQLINAILGRPEVYLASYGTLQPGESNHHIVADIEGQWLKGTIYGSVHTFQGYPRFRWDDQKNSIPVGLLESEFLPQHYERIDSFEGSAYKRNLIPVKLDNGWQVANVYVASN